MSTQHQVFKKEFSIQRELDEKGILEKLKNYKKEIQAELLIS